MLGKRCNAAFLVLLTCAWVLFASRPVTAQQTGHEPFPFHLQDPSVFLGDESPSMVLPRGLSQLTLNVHRKAADELRDSEGDGFPLTEERRPDFRYVVLGLGFGLGANLEFDLTVPYVIGDDFFETPASFYPRQNLGGITLWRCTQCTGITDVWASVKWQPVRGPLPLVIQGDVKFPELYRHSNRWLGSGTHDFHLSAYTVLHNGRAWLSPRLGYLWREGAYANALTYSGELGVRPFASERAHGFYLRTRFDGSFAKNTGQPADATDRYQQSYQKAPGRSFSYNDWEGNRVTWGAGGILAQWNLELAYTHLLSCSNCAAFSEWSLTASRPLVRRDRIQGDQIVAAPTETEARTARENSIVLGPGDGYIALLWDRHVGGHSKDSEGRHFAASTNPQQDYRYFTPGLWYGLPGGFEVSALLPFIWAKTFNDNTGVRTNGWTGLTDVWVGVRKQLLYNPYLPLGIALEAKLPQVARHSNRLSSEIHHDVMISLFTVKSGWSWWAAPKFGVKFRDQEMSDELPYVMDAGYRPPFSNQLRDFYFKGVIDGNFSLNNASPRQPGGKFGDLALAAQPDHYFTLNEGAMHRIGYGVGIRAALNWNFEVTKYEYYSWKNNYVFRQRWQLGFSRSF